MAKYQGFVCKTIYSRVYVDCDSEQEAKEAMRDGCWDEIERDPMMDDYEYEFCEGMSVKQVDDDEVHDEYEGADNDDE